MGESNRAPALLTLAGISPCACWQTPYAQSAMTADQDALEVVEICAGAGGQALGLEKAGFSHTLAVEIDNYACQTLNTNRPGWKVAQGDVADPEVWKPQDYAGVDLLAGGVPCPPFSIAGKQLGASDERDLFAWAVTTAAAIQPRALMLENVRGLSMPRFAAYRQHVLDVLADAGYTGQWRLLHAAEYGVAQLRPRFVLVALRPEDAPYFAWPEPQPSPGTVGAVLEDLMGARGWPHAGAWAQLANDIAPTIVGGSKKHGGADLGPTRAKRAWAALGVNGLGIADLAPGLEAPPPDVQAPKLTVEMVTRLQGWRAEDQWTLAGRKTAQYRQIGNAFPPPMARAVGQSIAGALRHTTLSESDLSPIEHDAVYRLLRHADGWLSQAAILEALDTPLEPAALVRQITHLGRDFTVEARSEGSQMLYRLGDFRAFTGQEDHERHHAFATTRARSRIS